MFSTVVHISPAALRAVYGDQTETTMGTVLRYIDSARVVGLDDWLSTVIA